jgi:hypothetical protein
MIFARPWPVSIERSASATSAAPRAPTNSMLEGPQSAVARRARSYGLSAR